MIHSVLDLFILSLLDRGLETPYDLQRQGGLSLGSTVPALRRLESAALVRKKASVALSQRPRHWFQLSAAGRKLARRGWIPLLENQPPSDFDAVLRLADMARHYRTRPADIVSSWKQPHQNGGHPPESPPPVRCAILSDSRLRAKPGMWLA